MATKKRRTRGGLNIWTRIGDQGDYQRVGAYDEDPFTLICELWREAGVTGLDITARADGMGVDVGRYMGDNYISVYWGTARSSEPERGLTEEERADLCGLWKLYEYEGPDGGAPVVPDLCLVRLDTTENYRDGAPDLIEQGGRLWDVYLFDRTRRVHAAELTPSYELEYLYSDSDRAPDDDDAREAFSEKLDNANAQNDLTIYVHCRRLDTKANTPNVVPVGAPTIAEWADLLEGHDGDREEAHRALMEGQGEHERCNRRGFPAGAKA